MIPGDFGLATARFGLVGHAVGHSCTIGRAAFRAPRASRASLGAFDEQGDRVVAPWSKVHGVLADGDRGNVGIDGRASVPMAASSSG
jgi:hypothetical protein